MGIERLWLGLAGLIWLGFAVLLAMFSLVAAAVGVPAFLVLGPIAIAVAGLALSLLVPGSHARLIGWLSIIAASVLSILSALSIESSSQDFQTMLWWILTASFAALIASALGRLAGRRAQFVAKHQPR